MKSMNSWRETYGGKHLKAADVPVEGMRVAEDRGGGGRRAAIGEPELSLEASDGTGDLDLLGGHGGIMVLLRSAPSPRR